MKKVVWGILSTARIGWEKMIPGMQAAQHCDIRAIASRDLGRGRAMADKLGIPKAYGSYEELLADPEIEAVYNPLPNDQHVPLTLMAARAGKHVLCEKPLATGIEEAESLRGIAAANDCILQVGHMKRFDAGLQAAKTFIDGGMGQMVALKAWYCDSTHRYPMTDAVQPLMVTSRHARKPSENPRRTWSATTCWRMVAIL